MKTQVVLSKLVTGRITVNETDTPAKEARSKLVDKSGLMKPSISKN